MEKPTLYLECKNCGMQFELAEHLNLHLEKFCVGTDYGDFNKIQKILNKNLKEKSEAPLNLSKGINGSEQFLTGLNKNQSKNSVNLNSISQDISKKQQEFYNSASKIASREEFLKSELEKLVKAKKGDETELLRIMSELEDKRIAEVRALKEKELVSRALKDLDKRNLNALEYQKKMQMKALNEERENLKKKEDELFQEIQRMQARLLDDENMIKLEKEKIGQGIKTIKDPNSELMEKRLEELSNKRGKEILTIREQKELLELEKEKFEAEIKKAQKGELPRKNTAGILAGNNIMSPLTPLDLQDRRNLPDKVVRSNQKWVEEYEKLNVMKKAHEEYVKNEPGYDVKPASGEAKPKFADEMLDMVKHYDTSLKPGQKARILEYIKGDLETKDPNPRSQPLNPDKSSSKSIEEPTNELKYNTAKYKLSTEPYRKEDQNISTQDNLFSPQIYSKYQQESKEKYLNEYNLPENSAFRARQPETLGKNIQSPFYPTVPGQDSNRQTPHISNAAFQQYPNYPYPNPNPYYPGYYPPQQPPGPNPEAEKLKKELKKLKKMMKEKEKTSWDPRALQKALDVSEEAIFPSSLPEEKLIGSILQQEKEDLKLMTMIPQDSEIYQAKLNHFKEMTAIRARMEASLQELAVQRMRKNFAREEILYDKRLAEEMWKEDQRKLEILSKLNPPKEIYYDYNPARGFYIAWDMLVGIPQKYRRSQIVYGVYERGEVRLEPRLVIPAPTEDDPSNQLGFRSMFKDMHDLKKLPPLPQIISVLEIQGIDPYNKISVIGWTVLELFTTDKKVQEGYWRLPVYRPPTLSMIHIPDLKVITNIPNAYVYLRIFAADNLQKFPPAKSVSQYKIPVIHLRDSPFEENGTPRNLDIPPDQAENRELFPNSRSPASRSMASQINRSGGSKISNRNQVSGSPGIWIRLESLNGFTSRSHLKFRLSIIRDGQNCVDDRGAFCKWTSEPVNSQSIDVSANEGRVSRQSRLPSSQSIKQQDVTINKQTQFLKNFYKFQDAINWNNDLVLIIEILERNPRKLSVVEGGLSSAIDDYFVIGWTLYVLTDPKQKSINFSTTELNIFKPPVPDDLIEVENAQQIPGTIKLTVQEMTKAMSDGLQKLRPSTSYEPFLENLQPQYDDGKLFKKGDGIDVYVDGARFLPDNTTCTKLVVKSFTSSLESIGNAVGGLSDLNSPAFSPTYGFRTEFRTPTFNPTTILVISIITIDSAHKEVRLLGYSAINLFLHKYRKNQPTEDNEEDFILNSGSFQLPIYCQEPFRKVPFDLNAFTSLEIIPCATLLVRIRDAPKATQGVRVLSIKDVPPGEWYIRGIIVPPSKYEQRIYNTSYCMPSPIEREIYMERSKRTSPTVFEMTTQMMEALGYRLDLNEEEMMKWIDEMLNINPRTPLIDMKYFARYSSRLGFKISIDAIHKAPKSKPHIALFSVNPPAGFYTQNVISQDVQVADKFDWNSPIDTPAFLDGFHTFKNVSFDQGVHVIIDIRAVDLEKKVLEPVAWTIVPVFYEDGYVKSGIFQIPLFSGAVPVGLLPDLASNKPWQFLLNASQKPGGPHFLEPVSVLLRIVDSQRDGHYSTALDLNRLDYSYIPPELLAKFSYNAAAFQRNENTNILRKVVPLNTSPVNYNKIIHDLAVAALDLPHL